MPARAQVDDSVEEVRVTAARTAATRDELSEAVTVVDAGAIDEMQPQLVTDALRSAPGVFVQQTTAGQGTANEQGEIRKMFSLTGTTRRLVVGAALLADPVKLGDVHASRHAN